LQVTVEELPKEFGAAAARPQRRTPVEADAVPLEKLGLEVADLTPETAESLGYRAGTKGVMIAKVQSGSLAAEAGLRRGMVIAKVDNQRVTTAAAARQSLENANLTRGGLLQVQSPTGGVNFVLLKADA
jgi:serine protease Do